MHRGEARVLITPARREHRMEKERPEVVVGVTGASGVLYARRLLLPLCRAAKVHLILTRTAQEIAGLEGVSLEGFDAEYHREDDLAAMIASGSHPFRGMVIIPCSGKTLAAVAHGLSANLVTRAADVCLKERRPLILVLREMPLSRVHLKNMLAADEAGATVMVASPPFYFWPETIDDLADAVAARVLDLLEVPHDLGCRWEGMHA